LPLALIQSGRCGRVERDAYQGGGSGLLLVQMLTTARHQLLPAVLLAAQPSAVRRRVVAAAVAFALSIAGLGMAASDPAHAAARPLTVVAVGDSYASGEGAIGADWLNAGCHRSGLAGPQDASARLDAVRSTSFTSFACSGATTAGLLGSGGQLSMLPPGRIDALTISIGGNDIGFAGLVTACITTADCSASDASVTGSLATLAPRLTAVLDAVPSRVTNVFVTEYPDPTTGVSGARCGTPTSPAFQGLDLISASEATWASTRVVARLNAALSTAVDAANARLGPHPDYHFATGISARFADHGYCTGIGSPVWWAWPNPRFIATPVDSGTSQGDVRGTMHPNDLGQQEIGAALFDAERFLAEPLRVDIVPSGTPVVGAPVPLAITVTTSRGRPVPGANVRIDGAPAGTTDLAGTLARTWTFPTTGAHTVSVDHDPFPIRNALLEVVGRHYTVSSDPSPVAVGQPVTLELRASDSSGGLLAGTFTLTSGSGTASIRSGASAAVTLTMRYRHEWEEGPNGKPRMVTVRICPEITFQPDSSLFDPRDVSDLVDCTG
jgi:lysophospholipase L1-like esterase